MVKCLHTLYTIDTSYVQIMCRLAAVSMVSSKVWNLLISQREWPWRQINSHEGSLPLALPVLCETSILGVVANLGLLVWPLPNQEH